MATLVWTDASVTINSVVLSDHVRSVSLTYEAEMQDESAMGVSTRVNLAGMLVWSVDVEFNQDYATGEVDKTLFTLVGAAAFPVVLLPVATGGVSATNPSFTGQAVLESYGPVGGAIGDMGTASATFRSAGALVRAEA